MPVMSSENVNLSSSILEKVVFGEGKPYSWLISFNRVLLSISMIIHSSICYCAKSWVPYAYL